MKHVLKISIILFIVFSNGTLFAQTYKSLNSKKDTLTITLAKDTLVSRIQDPLIINIGEDSTITKKDRITGDSTSYYRIILQYKDSIDRSKKNIYNKDAFKYDPSRGKKKDPWLGDILKDIFFR